MKKINHDVACDPAVWSKCLFNTYVLESIGDKEYLNGLIFHI